MRSIYDFTVNRMDGKSESLETYRGKVLLIVNTASKCGFTPQFEGLQALYDKYGPYGLVILGFPCNQFAGQEPLNKNEIIEFCQKNYGVTFPMFSKIDVNGDKTHPLYRYLKMRAKGALKTEFIKWNFTKFLVDRNGRVMKRFAPATSPEDLCPNIEKLL